MARPTRPAIAPAPRKTLIEWIEHDDGDTDIPPHPACTEADQTIHARIAVTTAHGEPIQPPPGLAIAPLG